jgi:hypothetical protein
VLRERLERAFASLRKFGFVERAFRISLRLFLACYNFQNNFHDYFLFRLDIVGVQSSVSDALEVLSESLHQYSDGIPEEYYVRFLAAPGDGREWSLR